MTIGRPAVPAIERFNLKYDIDNNGCWVWNASLNKGGYGNFYMKGGTGRAHRAAWILLIGDPGDMAVLHKCDVSSCVNPEHLFLGSYGDNNRDRANKGRSRNQYQDRTHCSVGHEFTAENTLSRVDGGRRCLICKKIQDHDKYLRKGSIEPPEGESQGRNQCSQ